MTKIEWVFACAKRLQRNQGLTWPQALQHAGTLADNQVEQYGASGAAWQSPEDAADEDGADDAE